MLIRKAEIKDLPQCEQLVHIPEMKLATGGFFDQPTLKKYLDDNYFLVAEDEMGDVTGLIFGEPIKDKGLLIWIIAISNDIRGKGIGSMLLEEFERRAKNNGVEWIILHAHQDHPQVLDFYRKHQFCEGDRLVEFVKDI